MKTSKQLLLASMVVSITSFGSMNTANAQQQLPVKDRYVSHYGGNPYIPLWEHLPDGEPRVFEDPDNPGKLRAYIIGSHDVRVNSYCGPDVHMWSAPVEDLASWRDEGPIFTYFISNQWDVMYAPDLVCVKGKDGKKTYYLYPHSRGWGRIGMVAKSDRPDGPFTPINANEQGTGCLPGSVIDFDPSIFIEEITDKKDPDYNIGFRAYGFWGFQHSTAAELDQKTMYSVRPGTQIHDYFIPASARYGVVRDPQGTEYPALYKGQNPGEFNFFEASSIRKVGNKYVMVFSGYSGPDYGLGSTNSALRYAYGDSPLGPWRSGGVLVDSRGVVPSKDGSKLITSNYAHNTHGSLQEINGQWYVFYHRPPRGFGNARQSMVAPVKIEWDEKKVADGGKLVIRAYDPYAPGEVWTAKGADGTEYTGAEVTSEGFMIYGLNPYAYYSAGYACFINDARGGVPGWMQDTWDCWDNQMDITGVNNGGVIGYKYFGFGGLAKDSKGVKAFAGAKKGNNTTINLFITPRTDNEFKIHVMLDGPYANSTWNGKEIATFELPLASSQTPTKLSANVASAVEGLKGKHAIYLVAEGRDGEALFDFNGIGFSSSKVTVNRPEVPVLHISIKGQEIELPKTPVRSTNQNGICDVYHYDVNYTGDIQDLKVTTSGPKDVKTEIDMDGDKCTVTGTYKGLKKIYQINYK